MKKYRIDIFYGIVLLVILGGCSKSDEPYTEHLPKRISKISAINIEDVTPNAALQTRVTLEGKLYYWKPNDIVYFSAVNGTSFDIDDIQPYQTISDATVNGDFVDIGNYGGCLPDVMYLPLHIGTDMQNSAMSNGNPSDKKIQFEVANATYTLPRLPERLNFTTMSNGADYQLFVDKPRKLTINDNVAYTNFAWKTIMSVLNINITDNSSSTGLLKLSSVHVYGDNLKSSVIVIPTTTPSPDVQVSYGGSNMDMMAYTVPNILSSQTEIIQFPLVPSQNATMNVVIQAADVDNRIFYFKKTYTNRTIDANKLISVSMNVSDWARDGNYGLGTKYPNTEEAARGVVYDSDEFFWYIIALNEFTGAWGLSGVTVPILCLSATDGYANTLSVYNAVLGTANQSSFSVFNWLQSDFSRAVEWYLPSTGEMKTILDNLTTVNGYITAQGGTPISTPTSTRRYWTSTSNLISSAGAYAYSTLNTTLLTGKNLTPHVARAIIKIPKADR